MAGAALWFVAGLVLLALGGDSIVKGRLGRAALRRFALHRRLLLVAFGTPLPELAVNARAVWVGSPVLALGTRSAATSSKYLPDRGRTPRRGAAVPLRRPRSDRCWWLLAMTAVTIGFGLDGVLSRSEGLLLLAGFVVVLAFLICAAAASRSNCRRTSRATPKPRRARPEPRPRRDRHRRDVLLARNGWCRARPIVGPRVGHGPLVPACCRSRSAPRAAGNGRGGGRRARQAGRHGRQARSVPACSPAGGARRHGRVPAAAAAGPVRAVRKPAAFAFALVLCPMTRSQLEVSRHRRHGAVARVRRVAGVGVAAHHRMIAALHRPCEGPIQSRHDPRADASSFPLAAAVRRPPVAARGRGPVPVQDLTAGLAGNGPSRSSSSPTCWWWPRNSPGCVKSQPVMMAAGLIWGHPLAFAAARWGMSDALHEAVSEYLLEFASAAVPARGDDLRQRDERAPPVRGAARVAAAQGAWAIARLFWTTGALAFCLSPIIDNLTTALVMCAVVLAVGATARSSCRWHASTSWSRPTPAARSARSATSPR